MLTGEERQGTMANLKGWLQTELKERGLTQAQVAVYSGVGQATISDIMRKGHVPKVETLFRLADYFHVSRERVLRLAGHLPPAPDGAGADAAEEALVRQLVEGFRQVPDEWKQEVLDQVTMFVRLASLPPARVIGEEEEAGGEEQEAASEAA